MTGNVATGTLALMQAGTGTGSAKPFWATLPSGSSSALSSLSDVALSTLVNGQVLTYSTVSSVWYNATPSGGSAAPGWTLDAPQYVTIGAENAADDAFGGNDYSAENALDTGGTRFSGATAWAANNQGTSTITVGSGRIVIVPQINSQHHGVEQAVPAGNWRFRALLALQIDSASNTFETSLYVRASGGHMIVSGPSYISATPGVFVDVWNSMSSFSNGRRSPDTKDWRLWPGYGWFAVEYDGTNIIYRASPSGIEGSFSKYYSEAAATFVGTPSHIGLAALSAADTGALVCDRFVRAA